MNRDRRTEGLCAQSAYLCTLSLSLWYRQLRVRGPKANAPATASPSGGETSPASQVKATDQMR